MKLSTSSLQICVLTCPDQTDASADVFALQYAEKLDDARKKKLEDMIAAAKSGKGVGGGATAAAAPAPAVGSAKACFLIGISNGLLWTLVLSPRVHTALCLFLPGKLLIFVCILQAVPSVTQALSSRDTNRQPAAAPPPPGKKPLRPAPTQHQNSKSIADDDDAALQVRSSLHCLVNHMMTLIIILS